MAYLSLSGEINHLLFIFRQKKELLIETDGINFLVFRLIWLPLLIVESPYLWMFVQLFFSPATGFFDALRWR
jgi:hypothetical protein